MGKMMYISKLSCLTAAVNGTIKPEPPMAQRQVSTPAKKKSDNFEIRAESSPVRSSSTTLYPVPNPTLFNALIVPTVDAPLIAMVSSISPCSSVWLGMVSASKERKNHHRPCGGSAF
jgi:hypothetical protein